MLEIELTEKQNKIWVDAGERLAASVPIKHLALQYYIQYRENLLQYKLHIDSDERITNLIQIAYFISQKNQITFNLRGERVTGVALSINQIIKKNNDFEDFIYHMKEMLKVITIEDKTVEQQIEGCLKKFKFTMTFHHKFAATFKKIKPYHGDSALFQSLLWLIFIICKQRLSETDIIDSTCLIASTFIYFVRECLVLTKSEFYMEDPLYGGVLNKESVEHVFLEYFRLKDMGKYSKMEKLFNEQIKELKTKITAQNFFQDKNVQTVYRKVDYLYQKRLNGTCIDQRHFLKERINTILNANRFTPFGGRRPANQAKSTFAPSQILSHRILNYQQPNHQPDQENQVSSVEENRENTGPVLLRTLMGNKTPSRTPLIRATPITNAMEMYNWVVQKSNYHKFTKSDFPEILGNQQEILQLINGLWKDLCMFQSQKMEITTSCRQALLALSTEIVYFVQNKQGSFETLIKDLSLSWFTVWSKIDSILKYDNRMPTSIKIHLLSLQSGIVVKRLWSSQTYSAIFEPETSQRPDNPEFQRLFKRVIHEIVYQVYFLCKKLEVKQSTMNSIFLICQYAVGEYQDLLHHRNLHQLILCSCYAVSKAQDTNLSFHSILMTFKELNNFSKEDYEELIQKIYVDEETVTDIINFYNSIFIKKTKHYLLQVKYDNPGMIDISKRRNIIQSPVKQLLSKNLVALSEKNKTPQQTPFTQALLAYNQSPLLKEKRMKNLANCIDGKRLLEKKEQNKDDAIKQVNSLISKKWRNCKSPEVRLADTVKKGQN